MGRAESGASASVGPPASWIRIGLGAAAAGYLVGAVWGLAALPLEWRHRGPEVGAALVLCAAFALAWRRPRTASLVAISAIFAEITFSVAHSGTHTSGVFVYPVLGVGAAFLVGRRGGLAVALLSAAAVPVAGVLGARWAGGTWTTPQDPFRATVAGIVSVSAALMAWVILGAHRMALAASERARRRFEALFASAPDALVAIDGHDRVAAANRAAARLLGREEAELVGRGLGEVLGPEVEEAVRAADASRPAPPRAEVRAPGSARRTVEVTAWELEHAEVGGPRALVVLRDVTERLVLEERLRDAERLESLGLLAGGVAHDFSNLLGIFRGCAGPLADHPDAQVRSAAADALEAEQRGTALVQQLLTFARSGPAHPERLDLGDELRAAERLLQRVVGERHPIVLEVAGAAPVHADRSQLEQVVLNLAANARDALPAGGEIRIRVRTVPRAEALTLGSSVDAPAQVLLEVEDGGVGMSRETAARVFEPFFTTKPRGRGTGLGLATVHGVVARSGGCVAVRTAPRAGSTFRVFLPSTSGAAGEVPPALPAASGA